MTTVERTRAPLPEGTVPVAVGLILAGVASFAFFKVGAVAMGGKEEFKPVQSLWFGTFALAPGFFLPLEQELARALAHRRTRGEGGRPVVVKVLKLGVLLAVAVATLTLAMSRLIADHYFDGDWWMALALTFAFVCYAPAHLARGICSGSGRFHDYAIVLGADGIIRIALCVLLAIVGISTAGPYGFAVAIAPLIGIGIVAHRRALHTEPGPPASWSEVTPNLGWLLVGSVFAAALVNAGPIATTLLGGPDDKERVSEFAYGILLARVPLFMFQAVQAALLPKLSRLAAAHDFVEFRNGLKRLFAVVIGIGVIGTAGALVLGRPVAKLMYDADLTGRTLAMLALASAGYMLALSMAQAVIALHGHSFQAIGWGAGLGAFVVVTWLAGDDLFRRVEIGLVAASFTSLALFALALRQRLRSGARPDALSILEAATDQPLEG